MSKAVRDLIRSEMRRVLAPDLYAEVVETMRDTPQGARIDTPIARYWANQAVRALLEDAT